MEVAFRAAAGCPLTGPSSTPTGTLELEIPLQPPNEEAGAIDVRPHRAVRQSCGSRRSFEPLELTVQLLDRPGDFVHEITLVCPLPGNKIRSCRGLHTFPRERPQLPRPVRFTVLPKPAAVMGAQDVAKGPSGRHSFRLRGGRAADRCLFGLSVLLGHGGELVRGVLDVVGVGPASEGESDSAHRPARVDTHGRQDG